MLRLLRTLWMALWVTAWRRTRRGPLLPSWSFRFEWIITFMKRDWADLWRQPPEFIRRHTERLAQWPTDLRAVKRRDEPLAGVPCRWFAPPNTDGRGVLLYLHGGSYQFGSSKTHGPLIGRLALRAGVPAVAADYRLLPEHPRAAILEDTLKVYRALLAQGRSAANVAVAGDSAGGHLIIELCRALAGAGEPLPAAAVLFSPWLDLSSSSDSFRRNAAYDYGTREMLVTQATTYAAGLPLTAPEVSPAFRDSVPLPSSLLVIGTAELLLDEARAFAGRHAPAVRLLELRDLPHNGQLFPDEHPEGRRALDEAAAFLRGHLAR